ncbi:WD repeat-containing protein 70, partial [Phlyctochytrium bullatum]
SMERAHMSGNVISSVNASIDGHGLVSRAFDDTLKLWDLRNFKKPVAEVGSLPNLFEENNAIFSPDNRLVVTGISNRKGERVGKVVFYSRVDLAPVQEKVFGDSMVRVSWHGRLNQILCTSAEGEVFVTYDQRISSGGAKLCANRKVKERSTAEYAVKVDELSRTVLTPHALPMFKDEQPRKTKRQLERLRADPVASKKPDMPLSGPGKGGKLGSSSAQGILKQIMKDTTRDEDPREAILRHAAEAEESPYWVMPAYKQNQPKPVMTERVYEDDIEEARAAKKRRPK